MTAKFSVGGMSCSACSTGIEKALRRLEGVKTVEVSLMAKSMTVDFDEQKISSDMIIATVEKLGYTAKPFGQDAENTSDKVKKRFFISLMLLIPLMYLSMGAMIGLPVPSQKINYPVQAVLALIIMIINIIWLQLF